MRAAILLRDHWEWSVPSVPPPIFGPADERTYLPRLPLLTLRVTHEPWAPDRPPQP